MIKKPRSGGPISFRGGLLIFMAIAVASAALVALGLIYLSPGLLRAMDAVGGP